ncbi:MAG TPA: FAD-dependent oxidoreductase, partial [Polyangia bacterium]|nr:FAD-dependent oxidoreductase [Polyangia bacterium]
MQLPVVILGGGLTGISAAMHLRAPWLLFEREARLGGHARTDEHDGFRFDKTGHWLHLRDPAIKQLVDQLLPGRMKPIARRARIFSHGVLTRYPYQANLHGLPPEVVKECLLGVVQAKLQDKTADSAAGEPRNFEEYCLRHFGAGISKHFMVPYNEKIWGVHPREITAAWCARFVPLPNLEQIIAGAVGAGPPEMGYNQTFLYPTDGGIETFTRALAGRLAAGRVATGASPDAIDWRRREVTVGGDAIAYRALVATLSLPELLKRMDGLPPAVEAAAARLRCTTLRYLNIATRSRPPADWHWIYVPEKRYPFYRVNVFSTAMPSMAPEGCASICVEMADRGPVSDATVTETIAALVQAGALAHPDDVLFVDDKQIE